MRGMIERSGLISRSSAPPSLDSLDAGAEAPVLSQGLAASDTTQRSPGTVALLGAMQSDGTARFARTVKTEPTAPSRPSSAAATSKPSEAAVLEQKIRNHPAFRRLSSGDQQVAHWIMWRAAQAEPEKRLYYLNKLTTLFDTRHSPPASLGAKELPRQLNEQIDADLAKERARGDVFKGEEEQASAAARMTIRSGRGGVLYRIDARDPKNIVVKLKVRLKGDPQLVVKIKGLEDAIEKRASGPGYTVDLEFVDARAADVYEVLVDSNRWPTVENWAGPAECIAHELHHVLGLRDRYDYIERHAGNQSFSVSNRLYYFAVQMMRSDDPRGASSLMGLGGVLLSEDVCAIAQGSQKECIDERQRFDPPELPPYDGHRVH